MSHSKTHVGTFQQPTTPISSEQLKQMPRISKVKTDSSSATSSPSQSRTQPILQISIRRSDSEPEDDNDALSSPANKADQPLHNLNTTPGHYALDNLKYTSYMDKYTHVTLIDGKWTELGCAICGCNAGVNGGYFKGAIGTFNHVKTHFQEKSERKLEPVISNFARREVSLRDVELMKARQESQDQEIIKKKVVKETKSPVSKRKTDDVGMTTPRKKTKKSNVESTTDDDEALPVRRA